MQYGVRLSTGHLPQEHCERLCCDCRTEEGWPERTRHCPAWPASGFGQTTGGIMQTVGRLSANRRPTVGQQTANCRPTDDRQSTDSRLTGAVLHNYRKKSRKPQVMNHCLIRENSDSKMLPLSLMFNILCESYFISKLKKKIPTIFLDSFIFTFLHISAFLWSHESLKIIYQSCYIITPSMLQAIRLFCRRYMYSHFASALNISMQGMQELIFCK